MHHKIHTFEVYISSTAFSVVQPWTLSHSEPHHHSRKKPHTHWQTLPIPLSPEIQAGTTELADSLNLPILGTSYRWDRITCDLFV